MWQGAMRPRSSSIFIGRKKKIPFKLPAHNTYILQPLDLDAFSPLKKAHPKYIINRVYFGDAQYAKPDFLSGLSSILKSAFK